MEKILKEVYKSDGVLANLLIGTFSWLVSGIRTLVVGIGAVADFVFDPYRIESSPNSSDPSRWTIDFDRVGPVIVGTLVREIPVPSFSIVDNFGADQCGIGALATTGRLAAITTMSESSGTYGGIDYVRIDGRNMKPSDLPTTASGIGIASTLAEVLAAYPAAEVSPGHYDPTAHDVVVKNGQGQAMVFYIEAGAGVTSITVGRIPQVNYLEGCA